MEKDNLSDRFIQPTLNTPIHTNEKVPASAAGLHPGRLPGGANGGLPARIFVGRLTGVGRSRRGMTGTWQSDLPLKSLDSTVTI